MYITWFKRLTALGLLLLLVLAGPALLDSPATTAQAADSQWTARYWANRNLSGDPALRRQENNLDHDWGHGSPDSLLIPNDNFSARWTRSVGFPAGTYRFTATMDDGMRVWVDDRLIIDSWIDSQVRSLSADVGLSGGDHNIRVEYYEAGGMATARLNWAIIGGPPAGGGGGTGGPINFPTPPTANFRGDYFGNVNLSGSPAFTRTDPAINFNWGTGSPAPNFPADRFSVRWTGATTLDAGRYRFQVLTDDGVRLWVNGVPLIDEWHDARGQTYSAEIMLPGGSTAIQMEYYENVGDARAFLTWARSDGTGSTGSWQGEYFNNRNLSGGPALVRLDNNINFNWGTGSPAPGISSDNFSARWTQSLPLAAGRYRFSATVDDGVRVWVGGQRIIDSWQDGRVRTVSGEVNVPGGLVPVQVEYFEHLDQAQIQLSWQLIAAGGGGGTIQPPSGQVGTATVLVPRLNVRTGPGTRFEVVTVLTLGQSVPMTGFRDATGTWTTVNVNGREAWVSALPGYLSTTVQVSSLPVWTGTSIGGQPIPSGPLATVGSSVYALNMRTGPGVQFEIIRALRNGTVVQVVGRNAASSWLQVRTLDGTVGWLSAPYMITTTPISSLPITG